MSQPRRLLDDGSADPELARLVRAARPPTPIDAAAFERSRKQVFALGSVSAALGVLGWVKHAALGAVLGTTVAVAASAPRLFAARDTVASSSNTPLRSRAPVRAVERGPVEPAGPAEVEVHSEPVRTPALPSAPALSDGGLSREIALLESARSELERRPGAALALLAQHEREFSRGALALEREFLVISALVRLGRREEAEARAAALRARSPGSLYEQRLEALLGGEANAP
jgi:hypothetical protein